MKLRDLLKEIKAVPGGDVIVLALINKLKADDQFGAGSKVIAYKKSKIKLKTRGGKFPPTEKYLIELLIQISFVRDDGKSEFKIVDYFYFPEFDHFEYYNTFFGAYDPKGEILQTLIRDRDFTEINPPITEIKAKPPLKLPSGFDIEQAFYDFFNIRQISLPKGKFNKDEQFLGIKYKMIDHYHGEELIIFYFQVGGMFNEKFQVAYNLDDPYTPNKNYTRWLGYKGIDQTDLIKEIKAVPARSHPLNIEKIWDFISRDELKGDIGPFDINKNYIGFEKKPFGPSTNNMHFLRTYFRDNDGNPFVVIYSYNYERENVYDFFNYWDLYPNEHDESDESDEIPNDLLREIKVISGRLPFSSEEIEKELYKRYNLDASKGNVLSFVGYTDQINDNGIVIFNLYYKIGGDYLPEYLKIKVWYNRSNYEIEKPKIGTYEYDFSDSDVTNFVPFDKLIK
jgi:hypothetical protein